MLRRLGFARIAARIEPQLLAIDRLQLATAAAGPLLLDAQRAGLEQLESETVADLLARVPVPVAEMPYGGRGTARLWRTTKSSAGGGGATRAARDEPLPSCRIHRRAGARSCWPASPTTIPPASRRIRSSAPTMATSCSGCSRSPTAMLILYHAIAVRIGAVTGQGLAGLIRERLGVRTAFAMTSILIVANLGTTAAEFAGIASALDLAGVSRTISVPIAAIGVSWLVIGAQFKRIEHVLLILAATLSAYILAGLPGGPGLVGRRPRRGGADALARASRRAGDHGDGRDDDRSLGPRVHPVLRRRQAAPPAGPRAWSGSTWSPGAVLTGVIGFFVVIACAATLHVERALDRRCARRRRRARAAGRSLGRTAVRCRACWARPCSPSPSCRCRRPTRWPRPSAHESRLDDSSQRRRIFYVTYLGIDGDRRRRSC